MQGYLVFIGGKEFSSQSREMDRAWLRLVRKQHSPRLVVIPVASVQNPGRVAGKAVGYYKQLGTFPEHTIITDRRTANTEEYYGMLHNVEAICLTDGSPIDAVECLRDTHTHHALRRAVERRACVVGIGAGAMALGAVYWFDGEWETGLDIAPHLAILPHHDLTQGHLSPARLLAKLPDTVTLLGIDDATAAICHPDGRVEVAGHGEVMVYRSVEKQETFRAGTSFRLPIPESGDEHGG